MYNGEPSTEEWDEVLTEDKDHDYNAFPISFPLQSQVDPANCTNSPEASGDELEHDVNPQTYLF